MTLDGLSQSYGCWYAIAIVKFISGIKAWARTLRNHRVGRGQSSWNGGFQKPQAYKHISFSRLDSVSLAPGVRR